MDNFKALITLMPVLKHKQKLRSFPAVPTAAGVPGKRPGNEIHRIETLSDAVFAFSISLLVMSLEVPQTFNELKNILHSFLPFVATVSLVFLFWYHQYRYFRTYGLNDKKVILLNAALLVLILFYIYPLKFLFSLLFSMIIPVDFFPKATSSGMAVITASDFSSLVMIYSAGYAAIWMVFYLLYRHAFKKRKELQLSDYEIEDTNRQLRGSLFDVAIGISALGLALINPALAGICYLLILPTLLLNDWYFKKRCRKLHLDKGV
jgi:uncharacterized membrane protein